MTKIILLKSFATGNLDWKTNLIFTVLPVLGPREKNESSGGYPGKHILIKYFLHVK